jgi:hypothetical protein
MKLDQLGFHAEKREKFNLKGTNGALKMIAEMYIYHLKNYETDGIRRVSIVLTEDLSLQNLMEPFESVLIFSTYFDVQKYQNSDDHQRKLMGLNIILETLLYIAEKRGWQKDPLLDAYNVCISKGLIFEGVYKNKFFQSPDRKYLAQLHYDWDSDKYVATVIFYNKKKEEIQRQKLLECDPSFVKDFSYVGWDKKNPIRFMVAHEYPHKEYAVELNKS